MRRIAADLGAGPMTLYRPIASKNELVTQMADEVFGELDLPSPDPDGWRAKLELVARGHWALSRRHLWLPRAFVHTAVAGTEHDGAHRMDVACARRARP
ncbi:TetR/AcrR family transcriptional regulator [Amycolatopsis albispora]|nr:hypothetical protein [Amycolatopsis albispora]